MNDIDITLYLNEHRVKALAGALAQRTANTVEDELLEAFHALYLEYVPEEQRATIEVQIEQEEIAEQARIETKTISVKTARTITLQASIFRILMLTAS